MRFGLLQGSMGFRKIVGVYQALRQTDRQATTGAQDVAPQALHTHREKDSKQQQQTTTRT